MLLLRTPTYSVNSRAVAVCDLINNILSTYIRFIMKFFYCSVSCYAGLSESLAGSSCEHIDNCHIQLRLFPFSDVIQR